MLNTLVKSFRAFLAEKKFADMNPKTGEWTRVSTADMQKAQTQPPENIDTELFDLINKSYAYIGGHVDFRKPSDLPSNHTIWYASDVDGDKEPDVVKFGKQTQFGIKWTGAATDGSDAAKAKYITDKVKQLFTPGYYVEVSDAIMHILITRYNVPCVDNQADVEKVVGKKVKWIGEHPSGKYPNHKAFYERELGGHKHVKILLGKPKGI